MQRGAWASTGIAVESGVLDQMEGQGMGAVTQDQVMCALELSSSVASPVVGVAPLYWPAMVAAMPGHSVPDFIMQLAAPHTSPNCTPLTKQKCTVSTPVNALAASLAGFTPSEQVQQVEAMVLQLVARLLASLAHSLSWS